VISFAHVPAVLAAPHGLLEGPCVTPRGVAFSDVVAGGVYELDREGRVTTLLPARRGIGGLAATADGGLVVSGRDVSLLAPDGSLTQLYEDRSAAGFNDLTALRDGSVAVGVLRYRPLAGEEPQPGELIRITSPGRASILAEDLVWPNGIVETADGALLVSDFARGHVKRIGADGGAEVFFALASGAPDGAALDAKGMLWLATGHGGSMLRIRPDGALDAEIDVPAGFVSSVCFCGPALAELVVTTADNLHTPETGGSLLRAAPGVTGLPVPLVRLG
jgi:sugar lactone lactonase YvrE